MAESENETFDRVLKLAAIFDTHKDQDNQFVSWEEMKARIEALSETEQEMLLGLVNTINQTDES